MKKLKPVFILLIVIGIILPFLAYADLVPCGGPDEPECTFCYIFRMLQNIINYIWWALLVIAPVFIIAGGIMILTAGVKPDQVDHGKRIITGTVTGLAIAFLSWSILNVIFIQFAGDPGSAGFPWPWNEIRCTGGAVSTTTLTQNQTGIRRYCHLQIQNSTDRMIQEYNTENACGVGCASQCVALEQQSGTCESWCCLSENRDGQDAVCNAYVDPGWCNRTAPVDTLTWTLNPPPGGADPNQRGDASIRLRNFISCMYLRIPTGLQINSISDNRLCADPPTCNPALSTNSGCIHTYGSCHYGGRNVTCQGESYAVDFNNNVACSVIRTAAAQCDSSAWVNEEGSHTHVSVDSSRCNCNENITSPVQCTN